MKMLMTSLDLQHRNASRVLKVTQKLHITEFCLRSGIFFFVCFFVFVIHSLLVNNFMVESSNPYRNIIIQREIWWTAVQTQLLQIVDVF